MAAWFDLRLLVRGLRTLCHSTATALVGLTAIDSLAHAQAQQMTTLAEVLDGGVEDLAGPESAPFADEARIWTAQGRVRAAFRASDATRIFSEDKVFTGSAYVPETNERVIALEFDDLHGFIYTLTERALYREEVANPSAQLVMLDLAGGTSPIIEGWEGVQDLKLWPLERRVFVMTEKRIIVVHDPGGSSFTIDGQTPELYDDNLGAASEFLPLTCDAPADPFGFNNLHVRFLSRLRVVQDVNGKVMGYVTAQATGYGAAGRPPPTVVMACALSQGDPLNPSNWSTPTFDADPGPERNYVYWNPMPVPPGWSLPGPVKDYTAYSLDAFAVQDGFIDERYVWVACGKMNQVQRLHVTNAFPKTCPTSGPLVPDYEVDLGAPHEVFNVLSDRVNPFRFFAVGVNSFFIKDPSLPFPSITDNEAFGRGCARDMIHVSFNCCEPALETVWTAVDGLADHICKELDVTTNQGTVEVLREFYSLHASDGGVALYDPATEKTNVYIPSWGGVVRYEQMDHPLRWQADPASYQPAEEEQTGTTDWIVHLTEHIEIGRIPGAMTPHHPNRLFTASARGDFMEFEIDSSTYRPLPGVAFKPDIALLPQSWDWPNEIFGGDLAFVDMQPSNPTDNKFLILDITKVIPGTPPPAQDIEHVGLLAYVWRHATNDWRHVAIETATPVSQPSIDTLLTSTVTLADVSGPSDLFAFVGHDHGFISFDLRGLTGTPPDIILISEVTPLDSDGNFIPCLGIARSKNRLFVYLNHGTPSMPTPFIRIYEWDQATGRVTGQVGVDIPQSAFLPSGATSTGHCLRARFDTLDAGTGEGDVYFAASPYLLQMHWSPSSPDTLEFNGHWHSDYTLPLQDCRVYTFPGVLGDPKGVLTVKDSESFAIPEPIQ